MKRAVAILIAMTGTCLAYAAPAIPQRSDARPAMTLTTAERRAVDLQQGMKAEEVERLLGKPKRTSLRQGGLSSTADPAMGRSAMDLHVARCDRKRRHSANRVRARVLGRVAR